MTKRGKAVFWLLLAAILLILISVVVVARNSNGDQNSKYGQGFEQTAKEHGYGQDKDDAGSSKEYHAPGMRESDIQKTHGKGYDTY